MENQAIESNRIPRAGAVMAEETPTRGRPADQADVDQVLPRAPDGELTRRSRLNDNGDKFALRAEYINPLYDYQWWTTEIMGQPVSGSDLTDIHEGGWRPVRPDNMPREVPPGWNKSVVERFGQTLFFRPKTLSEQSRREDQYIAEKQKEDKLRAAATGEIPDAPHTRKIVEGFELYGEAGTHEQKGAQHR